MEKTSKKLVVVSVLLATIITGIGVAFGYFIWNSTSNTDISFTVDGAIVEIMDGKDITGVNLMPTVNYTSTGNVSKNIKVKLKDTPTSNVSVNINLKINSIDSGLNDTSFKYTVIKDNGIVKEGNFGTSKAGDTINLVSISSDAGTLTTDISSYTLYLWIDTNMTNPNSMQNQKFDFSVDVVGDNSSNSYMSVNGAEYVASLDDNSTGDSGSGVYRVYHDAILSSNSATGSEIPAVTDYRYYGANPNNYVCLDMEGGSTCPDKHLYRIIGSIYEELESANRLKVIKATPLVDNNGVKGWNFNCNDDYSSYNDKAVWATATNGTYSDSLTSGGALMKLLNSGAWWNGTTGTYYNGIYSQEFEGTFVANFTNLGLSDDAKEKISTSRFYLSFYGGKIAVSSLYINERKMVSGLSSGSSSYWDGKIGLMYPSDYGYASGNYCVNNYTNYGSKYINNCTDNNWIYLGQGNYFNDIENLITNSVGQYTAVVSITGAGEFISGWFNMGANTGTVRPSFYLDKDVSIISGDGSLNNPYLLK